MQDDNGEFVGPPPPAVVIEAESSNEAERFEEVLTFDINFVSFLQVHIFPHLILYEIMQMEISKL